MVMLALRSMMHSLQCDDNCQYAKPGSGLFPRFPHQRQPANTADAKPPHIPYGHGFLAWLRPVVNVFAVAGIAASIPECNDCCNDCFSSAIFTAAGMQREREREPSIAAW
ncbi:hypothetical protein Plut_0900 [Pelodictyon luteolum DSM 273]|uniref:Uncharacterized protein n=1 Tax=Chlorobium luteolum (strain DSM 273 / BCRC 81028 / 2530) TaxID=319225 RepID=Q3B4G9_CHLL3|nr:hypothetical protein Plut_0900 [Pelodictyon luteolum DSM 273]